MLDLMEYRGPDGSGIAIGLSIEELNVKNLEGISGLGHSRLRVTGTQPLYGCDKRFVLRFNGEIWNYKELRGDLKVVAHTFKTDSGGEVVVHLVEEKYKHSSSFLGAVSKAVKELDGEYAFILWDRRDETFALARDPVGVKQLYYGENPKHLVFCSEKKPLWNLNLKPKRVLPGEVVEIKMSNTDNYRFKIRDGNKLERNSIRIYDENVALKEYKKVLFNAVEKRVMREKKIGIIFSGGVDSVMIAQIAKQLDAKITCYTAGFPGSSDLIHAKKAAQELGFRLVANELTEEKMDQELRDIITAIESTNHLQVDAAIPVYFAVKLAKEEGIKVILNGQGPDELFAGYSWYPDVLREKGGDYLNECLWNDLENAYKETLEREENMTNYYCIELRIPYVDLEVIKVAMSISEKLKIKDEQVKYIHRKLADAVGIPEFIAWRPKEAAQHGSNVHNALRKVIEKKRKEIPMEKLKKLEQKISALKTRESLGSVYRYTQDIYSGDNDIQEVLDYIGAEMGVY